jgi:hypothetical protein
MKEEIHGFIQHMALGHLHFFVRHISHSDMANRKQGRVFRRAFTARDHSAR